MTPVKKDCDSREDCQKSSCGKDNRDAKRTFAKIG